MFWAEIWKISAFFSENFHFLVVKFSVYLNRRVFLMMLATFKTTVRLLLDMEQLNMSNHRSLKLCFLTGSLIRLSKKNQRSYNKFLQVRHFVTRNRHQLGAIRNSWSDWLIAFRWQFSSNQIVNANNLGFFWTNKIIQLLSLWSF